MPGHAVKGSRGGLLWTRATVLADAVGAGLRAEVEGAMVLKGDRYGRHATLEQYESKVALPPWLSPCPDQMGSLVIQGEHMGRHLIQKLIQC